MSNVEDTGFGRNGRLAAEGVEEEGVRYVKLLVER